MLRLVVLGMALVLLWPASALAKQPSGTWATVNVCDTVRQPDVIGIRASMPGTPRGARLSMRFRVQYRRADGSWERVSGADSGWRVVGTGRGSAVEYGWSFRFAKRSTPVTLRGVVRFRWRLGDRLPRSQEVVTEAGHSSRAGSDPVGYSAATCTL
jgi:hypothetical protein